MCEIRVPKIAENASEILKMSRFCLRFVFWNGYVRKENRLYESWPGFVRWSIIYEALFNNSVEASL